MHRAVKWQSYTQTQKIDDTPAGLRSGTTAPRKGWLRSITSLSTSDAALANTYTYDSCGNITNSTGHAQKPIPVHAQRV